MRKILGYLKPYALRMSAGLFIKLVGSMIELVIPWVLSHMIDDIAPTKNITLIYIWGGVMIGFSALAYFSNVTANRMASRVSSWAARNIRHDLFKKISYLSDRQTDDFTLPSLISRLSSDTYNIHQFLSMMQRMGVRAPILLIGGLIITASLEPVLTLVLVAVMPFIILIVIFRAKRGFPLFTKLQESADDMVRVVRENVTGVRVIKALSKTNYEKQRFKTVNDAVVAREKKANIVMALVSPYMNLFMNVGLTFVIIVGAYRVSSGAIKPGIILAFLSYFTIILTAMMTITRIFTNYTRATASAIRISAVLDAEEAFVVTEEPALDTESHIVFDKISFSYNGIKNDITDISFDLKKGQTLGIIGPTGSGKSTIIKLLMRFYDVNKGNIYIKGRNIKSIPPDELHVMFGIVFQNDALFADTIRENIDFGRGLSDKQINEACEYSQASEFIKNYEDGINHMLTIRGSNLSGGQKQRVLIARALAGAPEILILDDASSALDYKTDSILRKAIAEFYSDTTSIIITQRISSIMNADHIIVIDNGEIIGYGKHAELLASCKSYREISQTQMGDDLGA